MALSVPGSECIIPAPFWVSYPDMCTLCGCKPVICIRKGKINIFVTGEELSAAITPATKMFILCSPSNPTGTVYTREQLQSLVTVLDKHPNIWIISDEIYEHLLYDDHTHISIASFPSLFSRTITINGFSKCYSMTGFRLGYVAGPGRIAELCNKIQGQITSCASSIAQYAGLAGLSTNLQSFTADMVSVLKRKRDMIVSVLRSVPGVKIDVPQGAFYALPDVSYYYGSKNRESTIMKGGEEICVWLLKEYKLALVPGSAFGAYKCIRISYASEEAEVKEGVERFKDCLLQLIKGHNN